LLKQHGFWKRNSTQLRYFIIEDTWIERQKTVQKILKRFYLFCVSFFHLNVVAQFYLRKEKPL